MVMIEDEGFVQWRERGLTRERENEKRFCFLFSFYFIVGLE